MHTKHSVLAAVSLVAALQAQSITELSAPTLPSGQTNLNALPVGAVTLGTLQGTTPSLANITFTPSTAAAGVYNTQAIHQALGLVGGVMSIISANGTAAFDATNCQIDIVAPITEIGFGIGDWIGPMILEFYLGGVLQTTYTTTTQTGNRIYYQMAGGTFDRVDVRASTTAGNWVITDVLEIESTGPIGTVFATRTNYGQGCVSQTDQSFYESFAAGTFDLIAPNVDQMNLLHTGAGFLALSGLAAYVPPTAAAQVLPLTDDSQTTVTLSQAMPVGRTGSTTQLNVCSNGFVSTGNNGTGFTPSVNTMLNNTNAGWYSWHDYNPAAGGAVKFEEIAGIAYVTWDGVPSFGQTTPETFQFQFDLATGNVNLVWVAISNLGNGHLVGFSEGGASADPGPTDLSTQLPLTMPTAAIFEVLPLQLDADVRPIINTTVNLTTSNIGATAVLGGVLLGLNQLPTPVDLTGIGMPGCNQYLNQLAVLLFFPAGASSASVPFTVPNQLSLNIHVQSAVFDPLSGLTPLGATSSNAIHLMTGDW